MLWLSGIVDVEEINWLNIKDDLMVEMIADNDSLRVTIILRGMTRRLLFVLSLYKEWSCIIL